MQILFATRGLTAASKHDNGAVISYGKAALDPRLEGKLEVKALHVDSISIGFKGRYLVTGSAGLGDTANQSTPSIKLNLTATSPRASASRTICAPLTMSSPSILRIITLHSFSIFDNGEWFASFEMPRMENSRY